jgi:cytidylate kinase
MKKIITISREYGSGGRTIGQEVAKLMGYAFYDKEIIDIAAKDSGLSPEFIEKTEQNISSGWLYSLLLGSSYAATGTTGVPAGSQNPILPLADQVFNAQRKAIIGIAKKGPCVIVGRCADYILKHCDEINPDDVLNVFIYAPIDDKIKRAIEQKKIKSEDAKRTVLQIDKRRANHYNTFTETTWGDRKNYDVLFNSSLLGLDATSKLIVDIAKQAN